MIRLNLPLLSADEEIALARKVRAGKDARDRLVDGRNLTAPSRRQLRRVKARGLKARDELVMHNLALGIYFAKRSAGKAPWEDLEAAAYHGLVDAANEYDPDTHGTRFSSYAQYHIRLQVRTCIRQMATIRLPSYQYWRQKPARKTARGRDAAAKLDMCAERTRKPHCSLDTGDEWIGKNDIAELIAPAVDLGEQLDAAEAIDQVRRALPLLTDIERLIIERRFGFHGEETTLAQIGRDLALTREGIRRREARALAHLRQLLGNHVA